ncbi:MAG TPA: (Na+)-NQR maturation NqrM [Gammaproteobacteria bacterium]|nr:(Na+)-NQR maturation NqrM [Gammaproteobacteria bacterium]
MAEFIAAIVVFAVALIAMSIGVIFGNRRIKGSCGGLNNMKKLLGITPCSACLDPGPDCPLRRIAGRKEERVPGDKR